MSGSPESGTPIDALESGNVPNAADASRMAEILRDMNASGAEVAASAAPAVAPAAAPSVPMPPPQMMPMAQMPMMPMGQMPMGMGGMGGMNGQIPMMVQQQQPNFVPYEEESHVAGPPKKNVWSNIFDNVIDPMFVAFLVFTLSLPVLQTFLSKYATWAFSVGGQLSWLGLIAKSLLAGVLFALYKLAGGALGL
jgi:hypothetical protein